MGFHSLCRRRTCALHVLFAHSKVEIYEYKDQQGRISFRIRKLGNVQPFKEHLTETYTGQKFSQRVYCTVYKCN
jgi:hypothetical protein